MTKCHDFSKFKSMKAKTVKNDYKQIATVIHNSEGFQRFYFHSCHTDKRDRLDALHSDQGYDVEEKFYM